MSDYRLTILAPVYNEEECLDQFAGEIDKYLAETKVPTKILFVNDGSTDRSQEVIERICNSHEHYGFIKLSQNHGLSTAVKAGFDSCDTELVAYIDTDIQTTPLDFLNYFQHFPEYDMVNGIRARRNDKLVKRFSSKFANWFRRTMINDGIEDTGCPLKMIKADYAKKIPFFDGMHRFIPALIQLEGGKVKQIPIQHFPRFAGTAKYGFWNRIRKPLADLMAFRWMRKRYINYKIAHTG